jgi:Cof subfamily protein (haloacid dehalogenase superfamily)
MENTQLTSKMIRLVAIDVDGTLVNSRGEVTAPVQEAVQRVSRNGIQVLIISGRNTLSVESLMDQLGLSGWCISSGGALTINSRTGEILERHILNRGDAITIIQTGRENQAGILLEQSHKIYWEGPSAYIPDIIDQGKIDLHMVDDLLQVLKTDPLKLVLVKEHAALMKIEVGLRQLDLDIHMTYSTPQYLEITRSGVTKGAALGNLIRLLGIPPEQVAAIGDGENDISMFQSVGLGIAMGNAAPHVQQAADLVAPSNDQDGLAWALDIVEGHNGSH